MTHTYEQSFRHTLAMATSLNATAMASFFIPTWGPGSPDFTFRLPVRPITTNTKESPMFTKFLSAFSLKNENNRFSYLPEKIQAEIRSANEATTVYDIA